MAPSKLIPISPCRRSSARIRLQQVSNEPLVLRLPAEILLMVARIVLYSCPRGNYEICLFRQHDMSDFYSLSLSHRSFRAACISAGLLDHIRPTIAKGCRLYNTSLLRHSGRQSLTSLAKDLSHQRLGGISAVMVMKCLDLNTMHIGSPFQQSHGRHLSSLTVNLSAPRVWNICALIMANSPGLDTLGLTGSLSPYRARILCRSSLGERLRKFQGTSLLLRNIQFTDGSICVLFSIQCHQVTKLCLDKCKLYISHKKLSSLDLSTPLCPNVKVVNATTYLPLSIYFS
jgi:hypothetical protein